MERITRFSFSELLFTGINLIISKLFLIYLHGFTKYGASGGIILSIYVTLLGGIYFLIFTKVRNKFKNKGILEIIEETSGKTIKNIFMILLVIFILLNQSIYIESIIKCVRLSVLPDYSELMLYAFCYFAVCFSILCGVKSIVRIHSVVMPGILFFVFMLLPGNIKNIEITNLFPVFGNGYETFFNGTFLISYFSDMIYLMIILPYGRKDIKINKLIFLTYGISSVILVFLTALYILIIGVGDLQTYLPVYRISQYADYSDIMSNIESFFSIGWTLSFLMNISLSLYVACKLWGETFNKKTLKSYFPFLCAVPFLISFFMQRNITLEESFKLITLPKIIITMLIPLVLVITANLKSRRIKNR